MTDDAPETSNFAAEHKKLVAVLKRRAPQEWAQRVRELTIPIPEAPEGTPESLITMEHIRVAAACLAWWDFFGHRTADKRWPHLDRYLNKAFVRVPRQLLVSALIALGYPEKWAMARTKEHPTLKSHRVKTKKET